MRTTVTGLVAALLAQAVPLAGQARPSPTEWVEAYFRTGADSLRLVFAYTPCEEGRYAYPAVVDAFLVAEPPPEILGAVARDFVYAGLRNCADGRARSWVFERIPRFIEAGPRTLRTVLTSLSSAGDRSPDYQQVILDLVRQGPTDYALATLLAQEASRVTDPVALSAAFLEQLPGSRMPFEARQMFWGWISAKRGDALLSDVAVLVRSHPEVVDDGSFRAHVSQALNRPERFRGPGAQALVRALGEERGRRGPDMPALSLRWIERLEAKMP